MLEMHGWGFFPVNFACFSIQFFYRYHPEVVFFASTQRKIWASTQRIFCHPSGSFLPDFFVHTGSFSTTFYHHPRTFYHKKYPTRNKKNSRGKNDFFYSGPIIRVGWPFKKWPILVICPVKGYGVNGVPGDRDVQLHVGMEHFKGFEHMKMRQWMEENLVKDQMQRLNHVKLIVLVKIMTIYVVC